MARKWMHSSGLWLESKGQICAGSWVLVALCFNAGCTKYGSMDMSMMVWMRELIEDIPRLRKMIVDKCLKAEIVQEALEKKW